MNSFQIHNFFFFICIFLCLCNHLKYDRMGYDLSSNRYYHIFWSTFMALFSINAWLKDFVLFYDINFYWFDSNIWKQKFRHLKNKLNGNVSMSVCMYQMYGSNANETRQMLHTCYKLISKFMFQINKLVREKEKNDRRKLYAQNHNAPKEHEWYANGI